MPLRTFFRLNKIKYDLEKNNLEINFEKIEEIKTTIDQHNYKVSTTKFYLYPESMK